MSKKISRSPLAGIKVIELASFVAMPTCGKLLSDWGADVIKVETIQGDPFRTFGVTYNVTCTEDENPLFDQYNGGKKSIALDLKSEQGMEIFCSLLSQADVFVTNTRQKALEKLGIDYQTIKEKYPRLIYAVITGFGDTGPKKDDPGFDSVAFWGSSGFLNDMLIENEDSYPVGVPGGMGDISSGAVLFGGITAALYSREKTGLGDRVNLSLYGAALWFMSMMNMSTQERYGNIYPRKRYQSNPLGCPYKTKDNEWIILTVLEYDKYFAPLCKILGLAHLVDDPRYTTYKSALTSENRKSLIEYFEQAFAQKNANEWMEPLAAANITHDKLAHFHEVIKEEQGRVNYYTAIHKMDSGAECIVVKPALQSEQLGNPPFIRGPLLGENSREILQSIGYNEEQIETFISNHIIK